MEIGVVGIDAHVDLGRLCVLGGVGEGFGNDVIGGDFAGFGQPLVDTYRELDRNSGLACQRLKRGAQSSLGQDRRVNPAGDLSHLLGRADQTIDDVRHLLLQRVQFGWHRCLRRAQRESQRDQPLLGAVVQIAFETPPRKVARGHDPGARRVELRVGLCVGNRGRDQIGEVPDPRLGVGGQRFGSIRADDGRPPHPVADDNGRTHRHAQAHITHACGDGTGSGLEAVDPGGAAGAQHHRRDAFALQ